MIYAKMGIFACKEFCYLRERERERDSLRASLKIFHVQSI